MSRKILFHDLTDLRHPHWEGWPEARIARHFRVSRLVVRLTLNELGLLPRDYSSSNRFLVEERGITGRRANTSAANAARRRSCASRAR
jgi:hypothetical protein